MLRGAILAGAAGALLAGCSGGESSGEASGGSSNGGGNGSGDIVTSIELPPAIEQRLLELAGQLGDAVCERGRNCCSAFGFSPRKDCLETAAQLLTLKLVGVALGAENLDDWNFTIDEVAAAKCLEVARAVSSRCYLEPEQLVYEWTPPCQVVLRAWRRAEPEPGCDSDAHCQAHWGPSYRCRAKQACQEERVVPRGAVCDLNQVTDFLPTCADEDHCGFDCDQSPCPATCLARGAAGDPCATADSCLAGTHCDSAAERSCQPRLAVGTACDSTSVCIEGADCPCPGFNCSNQARVCTVKRGAGQSCTTDGDCFVTLRRRHLPPARARFLRATGVARSSHPAPPPRLRPALPSIRAGRDDHPSPSDLKAPKLGSAPHDDNGSAITASGCTSTW